MSEWISVKDQLPHLEEPYPGGPLESDYVLVFTGVWVDIGRYGETLKKRTLRWINSSQRGINVTHWMPLPEPPSEASV
jgi:Protein of unknown function (DUF551)